jgi:hypothetical protein
VVDARRKALIRALVYPIQFERDPRDGVDRVLKVVVGAGALNAGPEEYARAVQAALESDEPLAPLIPQPHEESTIRTYLAEVAKRLASQGAQGAQGAQGD